MRIIASQPSRLLIAIAWGLAARSASAQERRVVTGVVLDQTDHPVALARIQMGNESVVADDSGRFRIVVPHRDVVKFDVTRIGFMPSRFGLRAGGDTSVSILILPAAQQLEKVDVKAASSDLALERSGFARRLKERENGTNSGIFLTAADIDRRQPTRISTMFEDLPGVTVCRRSANDTCGLRGSHLVPTTIGNRTVLVPCTLTIFLDGQRLNHEIADPAKDKLNIDEFVVPSDVAGVEYYPSGNRVPAQFQLLNGSCGAAIIWTKRG